MPEARSAPQIEEAPCLPLIGMHGDADRNVPLASDEDLVKLSRVGQRGGGRS